MVVYLVSLWCSLHTKYIPPTDAIIHEFVSSKLQNNQGSTDLVSLSAAANYWYYLAPIIGCDEDVRQLSDLISSSSSSERCPPNHHTPRVVTVLGPPNIGKVAVIAKVCSQLLLRIRSSTSNRRSPPFELYAWVEVSNPFHVWWFAQSLLSHLQPNSPYSADPIGACSRLLSEHRCLVVIDGLQRTEECLELASFLGEARPRPPMFASCILVLTTEKSVATFWTEAMSAAVCNIVIPIAADDQSISAQQVCSKYFDRPLISSWRIYH